MSLILPSHSVESEKEYLLDSKIYQEIPSFSGYPRPRIWSIASNCLTSCFSKLLEKVDFTACSGGFLFKKKRQIF